MLYGLKIEGLGTVDGQYRFCEAGIQEDPDGLYVPCLAQLFRIMMEADTLQGRSSVVSTQVTLANESLPTSIKSWGEPAALGTVSQVSGTTIYIEGPDMAGQVVHWRREAILLGTSSLAAPGVYQYTGCTRGYLGTRERDILAQYPRSASGVFDREVFDRPWSLRGAIVEAFTVPEDGGYGDEETLFWFILEDLGNVEGSDHIIARLRGALALAEVDPLVRRSQYVIDYAAGTRIDGQEFDIRTIRAVSDMPPGVLSYYQTPATAPGFSAGDKILVRWRGSIFMAELSDSTYTGKHHIEFDPKRPFRGWTPAIAVTKRSEVMGEEVVEVAASGHVGLNSFEPVSLGRDILSVVMGLMTSTAEGDNGAFDRSMDLGPGIDYRLFDQTDLAEVQARIAGIDLCDRYVLGQADYTASALTEAHKILDGAGLRLTYGPTGLIRIRPWEDRPASVDLSEFETFLTSSFGLDDVHDSIKVTFSPQGHPLDQVRWVESMDVFRRQRSVGLRKVLDLRMEHTGDPMMAFAVAQFTHGRAKSAAPTVTCKVPFTVAVAPFQGALVSGPGTFQADGSEDLVSEYGLIVGVEFDADRGLKVVRIRLGGVPPTVIGPALKVDTGSYLGAAVVPVEVDFFVNGYPISAGFQYDTDFFAEDDVVVVIDKDGVVSDTGLVIQSVSAGLSVTLDRTPTVPGGQWFLVSEDHGAISAAQDELYAYQEVDQWAH